MPEPHPAFIVIKAEHQIPITLYGKEWFPEIEMRWSVAQLDIEYPILFEQWARHSASILVDWLTVTLASLAG